MSNAYPTHWLDTRFPFDTRGRNMDIVSHVLKYLRDTSRKKMEPGSGSHALHILDLGAGNGSNLKFFRSKLEGRVKWTCMEIETELAAILRQEEGVTVLEGSVFEKLHEVNLGAVDLVMSNALFDLFSIEQFQQITDRFIEQKTPFYFSLNYEDMRFIPSSSEDEWFVDLYHQHMERPQGFGKAMGTGGPRWMREYLKSRGGELKTGKSFWQVEKSDTPMLEYLVGFMREAIPELDGFEDHEDRFQEWLTQKERQIEDGELAMELVHEDLWWGP